MSERLRDGGPRGTRVLVWCCDRNLPGRPNDGAVREQKYLGSVEAMASIGWTQTPEGEHVCPFCSEDPSDMDKLMAVFYRQRQAPS